MQSGEQHLVDDIRALFASKWAIQVESQDLGLIDTGLVDSVMLVELLLELEQRFAISLPPENLEIEDFDSVARIAALVARNQSVPPVQAGPAPGLSSSALVERSPVADGAA